MNPRNDGNFVIILILSPLVASFQRSKDYPRVFGRIKDIHATETLTFPPLTQGSYGKVVTRHFMNLNFTLHKDPLSLLCFLIYHSDIGNTLTYSIKLLKQYERAIILAQERWGAKKIARSLPSARRSFKILIEKGLLIKVEDRYLVNPILAFSRKYVQTKYWQYVVADPFARGKEFINHVQTNYRKTKIAA